MVEIFILEGYEDGEEYGSIVVEDFVGTSMGVGGIQFLVGILEVIQRIYGEVFIFVIDFIIVEER